MGGLREIERGAADLLWERIPCWNLYQQLKRGRNEINKNMMITMMLKLLKPDCDFFQKRHHLDHVYVVAGIISSLLLQPE